MPRIKQNIGAQPNSETYPSNKTQALDTHPLSLQRSGTFLRFLDYSSHFPIFPSPCLGPLVRGTLGLLLTPRLSNRELYSVPNIYTQEGRPWPLVFQSAYLEDLSCSDSQLMRYSKANVRFCLANTTLVPVYEAPEAVLVGGVVHKG